MSNISLWIINPGNQKLKAIKIVMDALQCGLLAAKEIVDSAPTQIPTDHFEDWQVRSLEKQLISNGSKVECRINEVMKSSKETNTIEPTKTNDTDVVGYFKSNLSNWFGEIEQVGADCCTYVQHEKNNNVYLPSFRNYFGIPLDEIILFTRDTSFWSNNDQGLVITDKAIYVIADNNNPNDEIILYWTGIDKVVYKEFKFYFYNKNGEQLAYVGANFFFKIKNIETKKLESNGIGRKLASHLNQMANLAGEAVGEYDEVIKLEEEKKYDAALEKIEALMQNSSIKSDAVSHYLKGKILLEKAWSLEEINNDYYHQIDYELHKALDLDESGNLSHTCAYWLAYSHKTYGNYIAARHFFIYSMDADSEEIREDAEAELNEMEKLLADSWTNYIKEHEYKERKFIMPIKDQEFAGCVSASVNTFRMSNIPSCITFPIGHPVANELYIGHPYKSDLYVPYEQSEDIFFVDKIHELCYLLEGLGAKEISITSIKGKNVSEFNRYDSSVAAGADFALSAFNGERTNEVNSETNKSSNIQRTMKFKFDPIKKPYVPEGLKWYPEQTKWQRLVKSRLDGNLLEYNEYVSTSDTKFVSETEKSSIKVDAEYLWNKIDGKAENNSSSQFKETIETQWKVEVVFRSIKEFSDVSTSSEQIDSLYSKNEQEYLSNVKDFLEDDTEITARERKMLDRIRQSLGISEERAKELEASIAKPQLTEEEKEYFEAYQEYLVDGIIDEKSRKRLEIFRKGLGISEERAREIEKM